MITEEIIRANVSTIRQQAALFMLDTAYHYARLPDVIVNGETIEHYEDPVAISCRVITRTGNDETPIASQFRAPQLSSNTTFTRMQIPFDLEITLKDQIKFNDEMYDVVYVPETHALAGSRVIFLQIKT